MSLPVLRIHVRVRKPHSIALHSFGDSVSFLFKVGGFTCRLVELLSLHFGVHGKENSVALLESRWSSFSVPSPFPYLDSLNFMVLLFFCFQKIKRFVSDGLTTNAFCLRGPLHPNKRVNSALIPKSPTPKANLLKNLHALGACAPTLRSPLNETTLNEDPLAEIPLNLMMVYRQCGM